MHVAELRIAQRPAVTRGHLDRIQHVRKRDVLAVGHVRVPALSGIAEPDRLAVYCHVGADHHLWVTRLVELIGDIDFELTEAAPDTRECLGFDLLPWEAQHAELTKRAQNLLEVGIRYRRRQVEVFDRSAEGLPARLDLHAPACRLPGFSLGP